MKTTAPGYALTMVPRNLNRQESMKALNPPAAKRASMRIALTAVFATLCISSLGYWALQPAQPKDAFIEALDEALRKNHRNITKLLERYIKPGDSFEKTAEFLKARNFTIHPLETKPGKENIREYYASRKKIKNLVILTSTNIIITTHGDVVTEATGTIGLTGL